MLEPFVKPDPSLPSSMAESRAGRLLQRGTSGYPADVRRRLELTNAFAFLVIVTAVGFGVSYGLADLERYRLIVVVNAIHVVLALLVPRAHRINDIAGGLILTVALFATVLVITGQMGRDSGIQLTYFVGAAVPFMIFGYRHLRLAIVVAAVAHVLHLGAWVAFPATRALTPPTSNVLGYTYAAAATTSFVVTALVVTHALRLATAAEQRTENLLRNVLPTAIIDRLRDRPTEPIADRFDHASVLFADIVGFTPLAHELGPARLVELLNLTFSRFDQLAADLGVEKIKTIGDSYMVVSGLPKPVSDHQRRLVEMGRRILTVAAEISEETGIHVGFRVGIATGPVAAGVIGSARFAYDVWGDTVNLASRLEGSGSESRIHVSDAMRVALEGSYDFEPRGAIELKGIGRTETWLLVDGALGDGDQAGPGQEPGVAIRPALHPQAPSPNTPTTNTT